MYQRAVRYQFLFRSMGLAIALAFAALSRGAVATIYNLGTLGGTGSDGAAINGQQQVAGGSALSSGAGRAFLYTGTPGVDGQMMDLGTLGGSVSGAYAINASGRVVGQSRTTGDASWHAFLYTGIPGAGGRMDDLGTLGDITSIAYGVNDSGQVTGYSGTGTADHAFLYAGTPGAGGHMVDLGAPGSGWLWDKQLGTDHRIRIFRDGP